MLLDKLRPLERGSEDLGIQGSWLPLSPFLVPGSHSFSIRAPAFHKKVAEAANATSVVIAQPTGLNVVFASTPPALACSRDLSQEPPSPLTPRLRPELVILFLYVLQNIWESPPHTTVAAATVTV